MRSTHTSALRAYVLRRVTHCQNLIEVRNSISVSWSASELVRCTSTVTKTWPTNGSSRDRVLRKEIKRSSITEWWKAGSLEEGDCGYLHFMLAVCGYHSDIAQNLTTFKWNCYKTLFKWHPIKKCFCECVLIIFCIESWYKALLTW